VDTGPPEKPIDCLGHLAHLDNELHKFSLGDTVVGQFMERGVTVLLQSEGSRNSPRERQKATLATEAAPRDTFTCA